MSLALPAPRRFALPAALAGLLLLSGYLLGQRAPLPAMDAPDATGPALSLPSAPGLSPAGWPAAARADRPAHSTALGLPLDMSAALEGQGNLFDYARQLRQAADAGDAQAAWTLSRIHDYCGLYALDPQGYARDDLVLEAGNAAALQGLLAARQQLGRRCAGFSAAEPTGRAMVLLRRQQSAREGNLAAEASLLAMGQPLEADMAYRRQLVERVVQSQDADAFLALSPAMGATAAGDLAYSGLVAGTEFTQLAWQVAACRLGMACGADSLLMSSYCANAGICSPKAGQDFESFVFDAAVPRQGVEKMNELINQLRRVPEKRL